MFHETGPGWIDVDHHFKGVGVIKALLWNFDFDDGKSRPLKPGHANFLTTKVVPLLKNDAGNIWMRGSASRIGMAPHNFTLSATRLNRVAEFLHQHGILRWQMQPNAVGSGLTAGHRLDDDRDRSVLIWVTPKSHYHLPVVKPIKIPRLPIFAPLRPPPVTRKFKMAQEVAFDKGVIGAQARAWFEKLLSGRIGRVASAIGKRKIGAGVSFAFMVFSIWDTENNLKCTYLYVAIGIGVSMNLPVGGGWSGTTHGEWNEFETEKPMSCSQFGDSMRFTTAGVGSVSKNYVHLETPAGVKDVYITDFKTGTTIGGGAASYPGLTSYFVPLNGPEPFNGP